MKMGARVGWWKVETAVIPALVFSLAKSIGKSSVKYCRTACFGLEKNIRRNYLIFKLSAII